MRLKNIFLILLLAGGLFSCAEEDYIGGGNTPDIVTGLDAKVDLTLNINNILTKADDLIGSGVGYEYAEATLDEIKVHDVVVAVFEATKGADDKMSIGAMIGEPKKFDVDDLTIVGAGESAAKDTLGYQIEGVNAKTGWIHVVVVANSKNENLVGCGTYAELQEEIETNPTEAVFEPSELVKVGEKAFLISTTSDNNLEVPMLQLAAKVVLNFEVEQTVNEDDKKYFFDFSGVISDEVMAVWEAKPQHMPNIPGLTEYSNPAGMKIYYRDRYLDVTASGAKVFYIENAEGYYVKQETKWYYDISQLNVYNVETKSQIVLGEGENPLDQALCELEITDESKLEGNITFYTYEKQYDSTKPLKVKVDGNLVKGVIETRQKITGKWHVFWNRGGSKDDPIEEIEIGGWAGSTDGVFMSSPAEATSFDPVGEPFIGDQEYERMDPSKYELIIKPHHTMDNCHTDGVIHGNLYEVDGKITMDTKQFTFQTRMVPWGERMIEMDADIQELHYLFVKEHDIKMPNINSYTFDYSSDLPVKVKIVHAKYTEYKKENGASDTKYYEVGDDQYPTVQASNGAISISFDNTPINYSPTYIRLEVYTEGAATLTEIVDVTHYPRLYVEGVWNNMTNGGIPNDLISNSPKANHNLFTVTTIAADGYMVGDPKDSEGKSKTDNASNQLVSPKFVIASQWGVWSREDYADAQTRCSKYIEGEYNKAGTWRIPTMAEIKIINMIQWDSQSAISKLLQGDSYWSACKYIYYEFTSEGGVNTGDFVTGNSNSSTFIRCVHDVY